MTQKYKDTEIYDHQYWLIHRLSSIVDQTGQSVVTAVEVGVASGRTSCILLREVPKLRLVMVDAWAGPMKGREESGYVAAAKKTEFATDRRRMIRSISTNAVDIVRGLEIKPDLIFIDASHKYPDVLADCRAWWPLLQPGGVFCGHDIDSPKDRTGEWGVRKAVEEFCNEQCISFEVWKNVWYLTKNGVDIAG